MTAAHTVTTGRPAGTTGETRQALLKAAADLVQPHRAPTLLDMAAKANVGRVAAMNTIKNMVRAGDLVIVRRRWVAHSAKPVAEYAPATAPEDCRHGHGWVDLGRCLQGWSR
ncbi:MAG: hypothetical protein Q7U28_08135 [Aquabacterium sp.]|nr:hypothetical protein [Aquabacterium sp.]